jgi:hypothetical protein
MSSQSEVETELAKLKASKAPEAIEAGADGGEILEAEPETTESSGDQK